MEIKIIRLEFKAPTRPALLPSAGKGTEWYFTSLAAIFQFFSREQIGCRLDQLWHKKLRVGSVFDTGSCVVSKHIAISKKQKS